MIRPPPIATLFPYTTLFRSRRHRGRAPPRRGTPRRWPGPPHQPASERPGRRPPPQDRKSTRLNSSHSQISYAVFCLKKKNPDPVGLGGAVAPAEPLDQVAHL